MRFLFNQWRRLSMMIHLFHALKSLKNMKRSYFNFHSVLMIIYIEKVLFQTSLILTYFSLGHSIRKHRSLGLRKMVKRKNTAVKKASAPLKVLSEILKSHGRHSMPSFLISIPVSVSCILDTEANKFYDKGH